MDRLGKDATIYDAWLVFDYCDRNNINIKDADLLECWTLANAENEES